VPKEVGFLNHFLPKKHFAISLSLDLKNRRYCTCKHFLDEIKELGYYWSFKGGLSFKLSDVVIPPEKEKFVNDASCV
jgi:DNA-directed RNA polymerase subunit beta'